MLALAAERCSDADCPGIAFCHAQGRPCETATSTAHCGPNSLVNVCRMQTCLAAGSASVHPVADRAHKAARRGHLGRDLGAPGQTGSGTCS